MLDKNFWRKELVNTQSHVAQELAHWDGKKFTVPEKFKAEEATKKRKMFIKRVDTYMGIGDLVLQSNTIADTKEILEKDYQDMETIVMEYVMPDPQYGVHSLDILTILRPNGEIGLVNCMLWADCTGETSHSTQQGYTIDADTGKIAEKVRHYSAGFNKETEESKKRDAKYIGHEIKGVLEAIDSAKRTHKNICRDHEWVTVIGWDVMVADDKRVVFFEGNFAGCRTPRMIFIRWENMKQFLTQFFWPYDDKHSIIPKNKPRGIVSKSQ